MGDHHALRHWSVRGGRKRLGLQQHMTGKYLIVERRKVCNVVPRSDAKVNSVDALRLPDATVRTQQ